MLDIFAGANAPLNGIQDLFDMQQTFSPGLSINWDIILEKLAANVDVSYSEASKETFRFLVKCSIRKRLNAIGLKL